MAAMYRHLIRQKDEIIDHYVQKDNAQDLEKVEKLMQILTTLEGEVKAAQNS